MRLERAYFVAMGLIILAPAQMVQSQPAVTLSVTKDHGSPIYRYSLSNEGHKSVAAIILGDNESIGPCTLQSRPSGWTVKDGLPPTSARAPIGWTTEPFIEEEIGTMCIGWHSSPDPSDDLGPGTTTTDFMIVTASEDASYLSARAKVIFSDGSTVTIGVQ